MTSHKKNKSEFEEILRQTIVATRKLRGLSQTELTKACREVGLPFHQMTISNIETGNRHVLAYEAYALATILNFSLQEIWETDSSTYGLVNALHERHEILAILDQEYAAKREALVASPLRTVMA